MWLQRCLEDSLGYLEYSLGYLTRQAAANLHASLPTSTNAVLSQNQVRGHLVILIPLVLALLVATALALPPSTVSAAQAAAAVPPLNAVGVAVSLIADT